MNKKASFVMDHLGEIILMLLALAVLLYLFGGKIYGLAKGGVDSIVKIAAP